MIVSKTIKLHSSINQKKKQRKSKVDKILLYRRVFTINPLQLFVITYDKNQQVFSFHINNCKNGSIFTKDYNLSDVNKEIIWTKVLLRLKKYRELGLLVFKAYKNSMIFQSFRYFKSNIKKSKEPKEEVQKE